MGLAGARARLGDHDPSGLHIEKKLKQRIAGEAHRKGIKLNLEVKRVALTIDQINLYHLPSSPLKKIAQKRGEYVAKFGTDVWELDALEPAVLIDLVKQEINGLIDADNWKKREEEVKMHQERLRRMMTAFSAKQ